MFRLKGGHKTVSGTEQDWKDIGTFPTKVSIVGSQGTKVQKTDYSAGNYN